MVFSKYSARPNVSVCKKSIIHPFYISAIRLTVLFLISLKCYADGGMSSLGALGVIFFGGIFLASVLAFYLSYHIYKKDKDNNKMACTIPLIILVVVLINIWFY